MVIGVIGGYGGIVVVVVIVTAVAEGALVIKSNLFICLFGGVSCDVGSGIGFNIGCGHSSLALTTITTTTATTTRAITITTSFITSSTT